MSNTIAINAKFDTELGDTKVRLLIRHPMETGLRRSAKTGKLVAAHYIKRIICQHKGKTLLSADVGPRLSRDPYFEFSFKGGNKGDFLTVSWIDSKGVKDSIADRIA